jgi:hypothetical protein
MGDLIIGASAGFWAPALALAAMAWAVAWGVVQVVRVLRT